MFCSLLIDFICEIDLDEKIKVPKILMQRRPNDTLNLIPFILLAAVINLLQGFEAIWVCGFGPRYDIAS